MEINISNYDYHMRMLRDIARQNRSVLICFYSDEKSNVSKTAICGDVLSASAAITTIIEKFCEDRSFSTVEYCELLTHIMREKEEKA